MGYRGRSGQTISWMTSIVLGVCMASAGCGSTPIIGPTDGGGIDGGAAVDGGGLIDGGTGVDGGLVVDGGASADGGMVVDGGVAADGGPLADGGAAVDGGSVADGGAFDGGGIYPECEERGGACTLVDSLGASCPEGNYNPFSGYLAQCPTGAIRLCCVPIGGLGSPCGPNLTCTDSGCLPEASGYPPDGLCTRACDPATVSCPSWQRCLPVYFSAALGVCMIPCDRDERCRDGWSCQAFPVQPFGSSRETTYVCWSAGTNLSPRGLGQVCTRDTECLSGLCRGEPASQTRRCSATCDDAHPCLPVYQCSPRATCSTPGCGFCFPM